MLTKGFLEKFIDKVEREGGVDLAAITLFRERIEHVFFNDYGLASGAALDEVFSGYPATAERLSGRLSPKEIMELTTQDERDATCRYCKEVAGSSRLVTKEAIGRFIDQLEQEGSDPLRISAFRTQLKKLTNGKNAQDQCDPDGVYSQVAAEIVLRDMGLVQRFRKEWQSFMTDKDRAKIEEIRRAEERARPRIMMTLDGELIIQWG
ncbi:hypothetical protein HZA43_04990 [Candidatus Peregrinibacteria bacterium]|nr:hypothetical protein [Candidatus Peregrinibacteria bacterium]